MGVEEIAHEPNPAVRRVMLGAIRLRACFVGSQAGACPSRRFGRLYRLRPGHFGGPYRLEAQYGTEPIALVEVKNNTAPEPGLRAADRADRA